MDSHTIESAMRREELTEDEAYFILRFAGRMGYERAIRRLSPPWKNIRQWFIWIGGWEHPELSQWDRGVKAWELFGSCGKRRYVRSPFPVSLFGHRITLQGWGFSIRLPRGYLCGSNEYAHGWPTKVYWSPNGTPGHADVRFFWRKRGATE